MIVIIQYNAGNIQSVRYALRRIGMEAVVTDDPSIIRSADHVIFPGVGEASSAMAYLKERGLDQVIKELTQPILGICLGMQLMCRHSEENNTDCLGVYDVSIKKFTTSDPGLKIPQIGWNKVEQTTEPLFKGITYEPYCYFVHSYYADVCDETAAVTDYGLRFSSALVKDNFYGVQFHPEKSASVGQHILKNFLSIHHS